MRKALLAAVLLVSACDVARFGVDQSAGVLKQAAPAFYAEPDVAFAREALAANLKLIEGLALVSPDNRILLGQLAEGFVGYGFLFVEDDLEALPPFDDEQRAPLAARASGFYRRGQGYALRFVETRHPGFAAAMDGPPEALEEALSRMEREDVPGLFWLAFAMAAYLNLNRDEVAAIANLPRIEALLHRAVKLDERYYYGGARMGLGALEGARPRLLGGDPQRGRRELERAIALTQGRFLLHKVLLARVYAVAVGDRALFERLLREVVAADPSILPEQRLANEIARRRARRYLALADELF